ncbi:MAG TPA: hypothetical protein V6C76_15520 [Drouetiella sp.]
MKISWLISAAVVAMATISLPAAHADNSTIPTWMFSSRDHLLQDRQELLEDRTECTLRLTKLEGVRRQCDTMLNDSTITKPQHDALISWRTDASDHINALRSWKDEIDSDLMDNDNALRYLEDKMKRWACIK